MDIPDNYDMWQQHEWKKEQLLSMLPLCEICDEHITDEYYYKINGRVICESCLNEYYKTWNDEELEI